MVGMYGRDVCRFFHAEFAEEQRTQRVVWRVFRWRGCREGL